MAEYKEVPRTSIVVLDNENRKEERGGDIIESIGKKGIQVPLIVYASPKSADHYILVAGHRRLLSAYHFNIKTIPVQIIDEADCDEVRAIENMDRKQLHPLDEAEQIRKLQQKGWNNTDISKVLNITTGRVRKRSSLANLDEGLKQKLRDGELRLDAAEEFAIIEPADQKKLAERFQSWWTGDTVKKAFLDLQGINLEDTIDEVLSIEPCCSSCPKNVASDEELFPGCNGACKDIKCYASKLIKWADQNGIDTLYASYGDAKPILKAAGKKLTVTEDYYFPKDDPGKNDLKAIDIHGNIRYKTPDKKAKDPGKTRKDEIISEYRKAKDEADKLMYPFLKECADSYMNKNHRGETFPDSNELTILAKGIVSEFAYSTSYKYGIEYNDMGSLKTEDNRTKIGICLILCHLDRIKKDRDETRIQPHAAFEEGDAELPYQYQIVDALSLKTSKVRKKADEAIKQLRKLQEEYREIG